MDELREKCPWDRRQTIQSLRTQTIEELYELTGAITENDWQGMKEELGDLLLHILFYSRIASEQGQFQIEEVMTAVSEKLIRRHPHIYGEIKVNNEEDVKRNWEKLKLKEGKIRHVSDNLVMTWYGLTNIKVSNSGYRFDCLPNYDYLKTRTY